MYAEISKYQAERGKLSLEYFNYKTYVLKFKRFP